MSALNATNRIVAAIQAERAARPIPPALHRQCALAVLPLWADAPGYVRDYLTGVAPSLRHVAENAANVVASNTARHNAITCAAQAVSYTCAGNAPHRVLNAAAAAVGFAAGQSAPSRGAERVDVERQASDAFRAVWEPLMFPARRRELAA